MADSKKTIEMEVLRYRPQQGSESFTPRYEVPFADDMSFLQGPQYIEEGRPRRNHELSRVM